MTISRRRLIVRGSSFAAATGCVSLIGEASAQGALPVRRSLADLALDDPVLEALRDGVRRLKAAPSSDPLRWTSLAAIHGTPNRFNRCPHGNWYFLPWHRAYVLMYERIIRTLTGFPQFAMPYWDWAANRRLPEAFAQRTWRGSPNPLHDPARTMTRPLADAMVGPRVMSRILASATFEAFGTGRPRGQNSTDLRWLSHRTGGQAPLEWGPHNGVHREMGGALSTPGSPLDPIFLVHHANVDHIWTVWRQRHVDSADPLWLDMTFRNHFFNADRSPFSPRVRDLLDPALLGYSYGGQPPASSVSPGVARLGDLINQVLSGAPDGPGIRTFSAAGPAGAAAPAALEVPIALDATLVSETAQHPPSPHITAEADDPDLGMRLEVDARGTRALLTLRNLKVENGEEMFYRVFIDCPSLSDRTAVTDRHYVGTFSFFGSHESHGDHAGEDGHGRDLPTIVMDVTDTVRQVYGSASVAPGSIRVQILPVTAEGTSPQAPDTTNARMWVPVTAVSVERVEVAFVTT